jgi:hypothetical protein
MHLKLDNPMKRQLKTMNLHHKKEMKAAEKQAT